MNQDIKNVMPNQITRLGFGLGKRVEIGFGNRRTCTVALTPDNSHIEALFSESSDGVGIPKEYLIAFQLESTNPGNRPGEHEVTSFAGLMKDAERFVTAFRMDLEPLPLGLHKVTAEEIAEIIVNGIARGDFG